MSRSNTKYSNKRNVEQIQIYNSRESNESVVEQRHTRINQTKET